MIFLSRCDILIVLNRLEVRFTPQFTSFYEFLKCIAEARFSFEYIWDSIVSFYYSVIEGEAFSAIWNKLVLWLSPVESLLPVILMVIGALVCVFGKKINAVIKFIGLFIIGFAFGIGLLAGVLPASIPIPAWVIGIAVGLVAAVLYKFIYIILYSATILYSVYRLCYYGFYLDEAPEFSAGKALTSLAVAAVVLVLAIILIKYVEMFLSSALGSWLLVATFSHHYIDLGAIPSFGAYSWILELSVFGVLTIVGFVVQFKTRRRY